MAISKEAAKMLYQAQLRDAAVVASLRLSKRVIHTGGTWVRPKPTLEQLDKRSM
jgi:hypothetical protein